MKTEHNVVPDLKSGQFNLEGLVRLGAQRMLAMALEAEITMVLEQYQHIRTAEGKAAMCEMGIFPNDDYHASAGPVSIRATELLIGTVPETLYQCPDPEIYEKDPRSKRLCCCSTLEASPTMISCGPSRNCSANFPPVSHQHQSPG